MMTLDEGALAEIVEIVPDGISIVPSTPMNFMVRGARKVLNLL
jgi:hypothetical protein